MALNVGKEIAALKRMTVTQLRKKHVEVFGETNRSGHKDYLVKRIIWRMQANSEDDFCERARRIRERAEELANDADLRTTAPRSNPASESAGPTTKSAVTFDHDPRLPMPGSYLMRPRPYKGREIAVKVLTNGFMWEGQVYNTLSAVAKAITGKHWNGYHFFRLTNVKERL